MTEQRSGDERIGEAILEAVYDRMITSVCVEIACGMHRLAKTGQLPYSDIMIPRDGRPQSLGEKECREEGEQSELLDDERKDAEEPPNKRSRLGGSIDEVQPETNTRDDKAMDTTESEAKSGGERTHQEESTDQACGPATRSSGSQNDIWGRIPPKEPKLTAQCTICGRHVSALRFAPHLDKCMGIGNSRGSGGGGGTRSSAK